MLLPLHSLLVGCSSFVTVTKNVGFVPIVQYWHDAIPPALISERMYLWRLANPEFSSLLFDRNLAAHVLGEHYGPSLQKAFLNVRLPAMQADIFRVAYLHACGGIWIDAATECLAPLRQWLDLSSHLLLLRKPRMEPPLVWNGFIYSQSPRHPFLAAALAKISHSILTRSGNGVWRLVGPGLFREIMLNRELAALVDVRPLSSLQMFLRVGSSSLALPSDLHWSVRQLHESLYFE